MQNRLFKIIYGGLIVAGVVGIFCYPKGPVVVPDTVVQPDLTREQVEEINGGINTVITLENFQMKSLKQARIFCKALSTLEVECGIRHVLFNISGTFVCTDIDLDKLNRTPMERLMSRLIKEDIERQKGESHEN